MQIKFRTLSIALVGLATIVSAAIYLRPEESPKEKKGKEVLRSKSIRVAKANKPRAIKVKNQSRVKEKDDDFFKNPFKIEVDQGWDDEKEMTPEIKALLAELNEAIGFDRQGFDSLGNGKDRATSASRAKLLKAVQHMLALMARNGSSSVPSSIKHQALGALGWNGGTDGIVESLGFLTDEDPTVSEAASSLLMDQLMDFDTTEADMMTIIGQLAKMDLSSGELESILFAVSSFKTSNKVSATLALYDGGNANVKDLIIKNADFVFEEAEAESIQRREDIVQYGKDHPDGSGMDFDVKFSK